MDRQVEAIVKKSFGVVQKSDDSTSAHSSTINSMLLSPKGKYLFTVALGQGRQQAGDHHFKVWDADTYQFVWSKSIGMSRRSHPFLRFDMAMNDNFLDRSQRLFLCANAKMFSVWPDQQHAESWPSGHDFGSVSIQYNSREEKYYTSGVDGVWRVWKHANIEAQQVPSDDEEDDWD